MKEPRWVSTVVEWNVAEADFGEISHETTPAPEPS